MGPVTVALIALLMLGYASVRATVMQAIGMPSNGQAAVCGDPGMSGMAMPGMGILAPSNAGHHANLPPTDNAKHQAACPYCSAAASSAIMSEVVTLRLPTRIVFVAFHPVESHGPRGPPAFEARARGPPTALTYA